MLKNLMFFLLLSNCCFAQISDPPADSGGGGANVGPPIIITVDQVFQIPSAPSSWRFYGANGCQMTIGIWQAPVTDVIHPNAVVFAADKWGPTNNGTNCYWNPGTQAAHMEGIMQKQADGSFSYTAFNITFPFSCQFCNGWKYLTVDVAPSGDGKIPYLIVPASASSDRVDVVDTDYYGYGITGTDSSVLTWNSIIGGTLPPATHWRSVSTVEQVSTPSYSGPAISVEVFEGPCFRADGSYFAAAQCNHEKMWWAPQWGFIKNMVFSIGSGELLLSNGQHNPVYDMYR